MKAIIIGAGEVGYHLAELLSQEGNDVTVIEQSEVGGQRVDEELNVRVVRGNGSAASVLERADVDEAHAILAMTSDDRVNILACSVGKKLREKALTIARIHDQTYADTSRINYQLHFGLDYLLNPEALCAVELAKEIRNPGRVAVENFARGQIEVQKVRVDRRSKLLGRALRDVRLDRRVRIGYISRGHELLLPTAETELQPGDSLTLFGHPEALFELKPKLDPSSKVDSVRVVIFGGSETAIALVRLLNNPRFKIRIIEHNPQLCRQLAERFPQVTIIQGDATSLRLLEEEQIGGADYFIASTKKDEDNIMTCLQAAKLGAQHVQLVINKADYEAILDNLKYTLGVERITSPRIATANEVMRLLSREPVIELAELPDGVGRIVELRVSTDSAVAGQRIKDVTLPRGSILVALLHKYEARVPGADDTILAGDRVVAIAPKDQERELYKLFR
ncbi:MAG: Trk system potassium transporter TrkA [Verrucomicrobiota bacterium]